MRCKLINGQELIEALGEGKWTVFSGQNGEHLGRIGRRVDGRMFRVEIVKVDAVTGGVDLAQKLSHSRLVRPLENVVQKDVLVVIRRRPRRVEVVR